MSNWFKTLWLFVFMSALFMALGGFIGQALFGREAALPMVAVFFVGAMVINLVMYWFSGAFVVRQYGAREVTQAEAPKLYHVVAELAARAQIPMPRLYIMNSPALNAFATGRNPAHAVVCVTTGIMETLNEFELKGVLGHELSHVKNYDMLTGTLAAGFAMTIGFLSHMLMWGAHLGGFGGDERRRGGNPLLMLLVALAAPIIFTIVRLAIGRSREYGADADGAKLAGSSEGLAAALAKIRDTQARGLIMPGSQESAHLMIARTRLGGLAELFSTHPDVDKRIAKLRNLNIYG